MHDDFVAALARHAAALKVGDPLDLTSQIGAVNSERQLAGNLGFVADAVAEGGKVVLGGKRILQDTGGTYMEPTIVTGVQPQHRLAQRGGLRPGSGRDPVRHRGGGAADRQ